MATDQVIPALPEGFTIDIQPLPPGFTLDGGAKPSMGQVAMNAANKGIGGLIDMALNTPTHVINLAKAAVGTPLAAMGRPDLAPEPTAPPNLGANAMDYYGFTKPQNEPQTTPQRILDAGVQGGVQMAANPAQGVRGAVANALLGVAGGGSAQGAREAGLPEPIATSIGMAVGAAPAAGRSYAQDQVARAMERQGAKSVEDATLAAGREKGLGVPVSETNPSWITNRIEGVAGKAAVKQEQTIRNQETVNKLANEDLGFPAGTAITEAKLVAYRTKESAPYREVAALSPTAASALEELKTARANANDWWKAYGRSAHPDDKAQATKYSQEADTYHQMIVAEAKAAGRPELVAELLDARKAIAKSYDYERALNLGSGDISAPVLGRAYDKGAPLTGNAKVIADFQQAFPRYMGEAASTPQPGVSKVQMVASAILGGGGATLGHHLGGGPGAMAAGGAVGAALPLLDAPVRALVVSKPYQKHMGAPSYSPGLTANAVNAFPGGMDLDTLRALLMARAVAERGAQ